MAISFLHAFSSPKSDNADATKVQPSNWNAQHVLTLATNMVLGRSTAGTGAVEEIPVTAAARSIFSGSTVAAIVATLGAASLTVANAISAACTFTGANTYTKTQTVLPAVLVSSTAGNAAANQAFTVDVNGSLFTISNFTGGVDKTYYGVYVKFTTAHSLAFGVKFKTAGYAPTAAAGKRDHLVFRYNSADDLYELVAMRNDVGA